MFRKTVAKLQFPCECFSSESGYSDPWAEISQKKLLLDGTKEKLLNAVAEEPKTIAQLAADLRLSQPTIHAHVTELLASELLCESQQAEKRYAAERYYEPNFPVIRAEERTGFEAICEVMAEQLAALFEQNVPQLKSAFERTELGARGWRFDDVAQYCYAGLQRSARRRLEKGRILPRRKKHKNGASWVFWSEEAPSPSTRSA